MNTQLSVPEFVFFGCLRLFKALFRHRFQPFVDCKNQGFSPLWTRYLIRCSQHSRRHTAGSPHWDIQGSTDRTSTNINDDSGGQNHQETMAFMAFPHEIYGLACEFPINPMNWSTWIVSDQLKRFWMFVAWKPCPLDSIGTCRYDCDDAPMSRGWEKSDAEPKLVLRREGGCSVSCGQWTCPKTGDPTMFHHVPPCSTTKMYRPR